MLQGDPGRKFVRVPPLHRAEHGELWTTAVIRKGFALTVSVTEYPAQFYDIRGTDTEIRIERFAHKTTPLHRSPVVEIRATGRIVQGLMRSSGLDQGTVMVKASRSNLHAAGRRTFSAPRDNIDHPSQGIRTVDGG